MHMHESLDTPKGAFKRNATQTYYNSRLITEGKLHAPKRDGVLDFAFPAIKS